MGSTTLGSTTLGSTTLGSTALAASILRGFAPHATLATPRGVALGRFALRGAVLSLPLALPLGTALRNLATRSTLITAWEAATIRRTSTRCGPAFAWCFSIDGNTALVRSATIISILIIVRAIQEVGGA